MVTHLLRVEFTLLIIVYDVVTYLFEKGFTFWRKKKEGSQKGHSHETQPLVLA